MITYYDLEVKELETFRRAVIWLLGCPHGHRFQVQKDLQVLQVSIDASECLRDSGHFEQKERDGY